VKTAGNMSMALTTCQNPCGNELKELSVLSISWTYVPSETIFQIVQITNPLVLKVQGYYRDVSLLFEKFASESKIVWFMDTFNHHTPHLIL